MPNVHHHGNITNAEMLPQGCHKSFYKSLSSAYQQNDHRSHLLQQGFEGILHWWQILAYGRIWARYATLISSWICWHYSCGLYLCSKTEPWKCPSRIPLRHELTGRVEGFCRWGSMAGEWSYMVQCRQQNVSETCFVTMLVYCIKVHVCVGIMKTF